MIPLLLPALERLGEGAARAGIASFATWELRAALRWSERAGTALSIDGGWRLERRGRAPSWRFAVGAGPAARIGALWGVPVARDLDPVGWKGACAAIEKGLRARLRSLRIAADPLCARIQQEAGGTGRLEIELHARWRAWKRGGQRPAGAEEEGARVIAEAGGPTRGVTLEWCGGGDARPPWLDRPDWVDARLAAQLAFFRTAEGGKPHRGPTPRGEGPLVLMPAAAGWWVHEMGHAALETASRTGRRERARHRLAIVDAPSEGPWPAGFAADDEGEASPPAELWGELGPRRPPDEGRRRRASVREPARGALSVPRLVDRGCRPIAWGDLPDGAPVAARVRAGRFDPAGGVILLELDGLGTVEGGVPVAGSGRAVALLDPASVWNGARLLATGPAREDSLAVCTRQGTTLPVMVGAPTVVLEPVHLYR